MQLPPTVSGCLGSALTSIEALFCSASFASLWLLSTMLEYEELGLVVEVFVELALESSCFCICCSFVLSFWLVDLKKENQSIENQSLSYKADNIHLVTKNSTYQIIFNSRLRFID